MCKPEMDDELDLQSPSNAIKFKYDLIRMSYSKIAHSIRRKQII